MPISDEMKKQDWHPRLRRRGPNFDIMVDHVEKYGREHFGVEIVETGCARNDNNWEGDGHSTYIWQWLLKQPSVSGLAVTSIDIQDDCIALAKKMAPDVHFIHCDSVLALGRKDLSNCALLYLDSYDWNEQMNMESAFHHVMELTCAWSKLPSGCMVAVDDRHGEMKGKHWMVGLFMDHIGLTPVFKNYQIGWIKP